MFNKLLFCLLVFLSPVVMVAQEYTLSDTTKLISQLSKTTKPTDKLLILKQLTDLNRLNNPERAQVYVTQLETYVRGKKLPYWDGYIATMNAEYLHPKGLIDSAIVLYQFASERYRSVDSIEQALLATCMVGSLYSRLGKLDETAKTLSGIEDETRRGNYPRALALLESRWAIFYHYQGIADTAILHYGAAIRCYQQLRDTSQMIRSMFNLYILSEASKSVDERLIFLKNLEGLCRKSGDNRTLGHVLGGLSGIYEKNIFDFKKAHDYALEAYQISKAFGFIDVEIGNLVTLYNLAIVYGENALAESYLIEAEGRINQSHGEADRAAILHIRGEFLIETGKYDLAKKTFQKGLALDNSNHLLDFIIVKLILGLGEAHYYLKDTKLALKELQRARSMAIEMQDGDGQANTDLFLAKVHTELGNYPEAEKSALSAVQVLESNDRLRSLAEGYQLLSTARRKQGKYELALQAQDQYLIINDSLKNIDQIRSLTKKQQSFEFEREKEQTALVQAQKDLVLNAKVRQSVIIAIAVGTLSLLSLGFFLNSRRKNQIISIKNTQLEQLNTTKDRIFAIIGHDMRRPALAFRGMTQKINYLLQKQDYPRLNALGNQLEETAYSLTTITDNLLNWALLQKDIAGYQPQPVELQQVAEELNALFNTAALNKKISLNLFSGTPPHEQVFADPLALRTILRNLVDNAIKYTPQHGVIAVTATRAGEWVNIGVQDSGIGIPQAEQKDLFLLRNEKSRAGTDGEKGTGLGLHLAYELVKLNKGMLTLNTQIAKGTRFELRLPATGSYA